MGEKILTFYISKYFLGILEFKKIRTSFKNPAAAFSKMRKKSFLQIHSHL